MLSLTLHLNCGAPLNDAPTDAAIANLPHFKLVYLRMLNARGFTFTLKPRIA